MTRGSILRMLAMAGPWVAGPALAQRADTAVSFQPPVEVAGFRMTGREVLAPGAGAKISYQRPGETEWIDVYVYPAPSDPACAPACDSVALHREVDDFAPMIPELVRRGYYDSLRVASDRRVSVPAGSRTLRGRHLRLQGGRGGRAVTSQLYLVGAGPLLLKVRATYAPAASMDSAVEEFAMRFVPALRLVASCPGGEPREPGGLSMRVELASPLAEVRPRVAAALARLGYELEPDTEPDTWVTLPVREWPGREEWAHVKAFPHPGVQLQVQARTVGAKTEMTVAARPLCGVPERRDIETAVTLIAAAEVMMQFPEAKK